MDKKYTYSDSNAGMQNISFAKLSDVINHIENFGLHGDSDGIIYQDDSPIVMYMSNSAGLSWYNVADTNETKLAQKEETESQIGTLNRPYGLKGFITALPGHPVYSDGNRYIIYLTSEQPGSPKRVTFYKETLKESIIFY